MIFTRKSSSQVAALCFRRKLVFFWAVVSSRIRLRTIFFKRERFCGAWSWRTVLASSPKLTSSTSQLGGKSAGGITPPATHITVRDPLDSQRSHQANAPTMPFCQCTKRHQAGSHLITLISVAQKTRVDLITEGFTSSCHKLMEVNDCSLAEYDEST